MNSTHQLSRAQTAALAIAGVGVIAAATYYTYKKTKTVVSTLTDANFKDENLVSYATEADSRAKQVSNVTYKLLISLGAKLEEGFSGCLETTFSLSNLDTPVYLDFQGLSVSSVEINGKVVTPNVVFEKHRIILPKDSLCTKDTNLVRFHFRNTYVTNSAGLHYYKDPKDDKVYIFSHLEPFFCHRFFPCFDQPSIRAPLQLQVLTPSADWKVVANGVETQSAVQLSSKKGLAFFSQNKALVHIFKQNEVFHSSDMWLWSFAECPSISSYIYNLCAGDFEQIDNTRYDAPTPMRIFVRNSKKDYVDADLVFRVLTQGMNYYSKLFECPMPFAKYDVIYCPEFRITAMENVGAVTFTDRVLVSPNEMSEVLKMRHYQVHLHELAHMWFGDLTTMIWWNDLWLKESFADFLCGISFNEFVFKEDEAFKNVDQIWLQFLTAALDADMKPSTHPISVEIRHTGDAISQFDDISYRKGASWIKTMDYFLGRPTLQNAVAKYVKRYSYKNAALEQFVECLQEALKETQPESQTDLKKWTDSWLKTAGPNELSCEYNLDGTLSLKQSFPRYADKVFREQCVEVSLIFADSEGKFTSVSVPRVHVTDQEVTQDILQTKTDLEELKPYLDGNGKLKQAPVAVLPNSSNKGYCRVVLDHASIEHFVAHFTESHVNTYNRTYLWRILFDHIKMKKMHPNKFLEIVITNLIHEQQPHILPFIVQKSKEILELYLGNENQVSPQKARLCMAIKTKLDQSMADASLRNMLLDFLIEFTDASSSQGACNLARMAETSIVPGQESYGKVVNKQQRYACLRKLEQQKGIAAYKEQIDLERKVDYSAGDDTKLVQLQAADPDQASKQSIWNKYVSAESQFKQQDLIASTSSFYAHGNPKQSRYFANLWFENIESVEDKKHRDYFLVFFTQLSPSFLGSLDDLKKMQALLEKYQNTEKSFFCRLLIEEIDTLELIISLREWTRGE